jgi:hypothetical protein
MSASPVGRRAAVDREVPVFQVVEVSFEERRTLIVLEPEHA